MGDDEAREEDDREEGCREAHFGRVSVGVREGASMRTGGGGVEKAGLNAAAREKYRWFGEVCLTVVVGRDSMCCNVGARKCI